MPAPSAQGHAIRATRVGASEVGALLGFHPYTAPADIWARLVGAPKPKPETSAMSAGNALEPSVAAMWAAKTGGAIRRCALTYTHRTAALCATPDYYVPPAELLEIKVSSDYDLWAQLPQYVYWQAQAQMACTGRGVCHVAALLGSTLRTHRVERDESAIAEMVRAVDAFIADYVTTRTPPPDADGELVLRVLKPEPGTVAADEKDESIAYRMALAREQMSRGEEAYRDCKERLAASLVRKQGTSLQGRGWTFGPDARGAIQFRGNPQGANREG